MDKDALMRIFDLYSSALFNYAMRLCGDPVMSDHVVGDVFARLMEQLSVGKGPTSNLRSYLFETAYHRLVDESRYSKRRVPIEVAAWLPQDTNPASFRMEDPILLHHINYALRKELTEDQRHVIVLRFLEDFSLRETAAIMNISIDHVKVIQSRAIAALRRSLEKKDVQNSVSAAGVRKLSKALGI